LSGANSYTYNGDSLRVSKTVAGITTTAAYDFSGHLPVQIEDGPNAYIYGPDDVPVEEITADGSAHYLSQDQQDSTSNVTDINGNAEAAFSYDPYGNATETSGTWLTPFMYDGQYTDAESGLQYLRTRYYDPSTAQFLTVDPIVDTTGIPYSYAAEDPLDRGDPTGRVTLKQIFHDALDLAAVPIYAPYYAAYQVGRGLNAAGCSLGPIICAETHVFVLLQTPIPADEVFALAHDALLDLFKRLTLDNGESVLDEHTCGPLLPRFLDGGGPKVWLPGLHRNRDGSPGLDFEW
jgi:RHS repeat-associated protein